MTQEGRLQLWIVVTVTRKKTVNVWGPFTTSRQAAAYRAILLRLTENETNPPVAVVKSVLSPQGIISAYRSQTRGGYST